MTVLTLTPVGANTGTLTAAPYTGMPLTCDELLPCDEALACNDGDGLTGSQPTVRTLTPA